MICRIPECATKTDSFEALARTDWERLVWQLNKTQKRYEEYEAKQINYLSLEYLIGRSLHNNLIKLEICDVCQKFIEQPGMDLRKIEECE